VKCRIWKKCNGDLKEDTIEVIQESIEVKTNKQDDLQWEKTIDRTMGKEELLRLCEVDFSEWEKNIEN
jgi:hypothetical protein